MGYFGQVLNPLIFEMQGGVSIHVSRSGLDTRAIRIIDWSSPRWMKTTSAPEEDSLPDLAFDICRDMHYLEMHNCAVECGKISVLMVPFSFPLVSLNMPQLHP